MRSAVDPGRPTTRSFRLERDYQLAIAESLQHALQNGELRIVLRPIFSVKSPRRVRFEVVPRWISPRFGVMDYSTVEPICREMGLSEHFWDFYMEQLCATMAGWSLRKKKLPVVSLTIPHSYLERHELARFMSRITAMYGVDPELLVLQLSGREAWRCTSNASLKLDALRSIGISAGIVEFDELDELPGVLFFQHPRVLLFEAACQQRLLTPDFEHVLRAIVSAATQAECRLSANGVCTLEECSSFVAGGFSEIQGPFVGGPMSCMTAERLFL